jgi:hypothetical protein
MALSVELATATPQQLGELVSSGRVSVMAAAKVAVAQGKLLVGTSVSKRKHVPCKAMNQISGLWRPVALDAEGKPLDVVRASRVPRTAILCATFGDCNEVGQRHGIGKQLVESDEMLRFGWRQDEETEDGYRGQVDGRLYRAVATDPQAVNGVIDILEDDGCWIELVDKYVNLGNKAEPNHYISQNTYTTLGSIPLNGTVFLSQLPNIELVTTR